MPTFAEFSASQESAYNNFRRLGKVAQTKGIMRDEALDGKMCGFFVNLVHDRRVALAASEFSMRLSRITGADPYGTADIHTTIASKRVPSKPRIVSYSSDFRETLEAIVAAVHAAINNLRIERGSIEIDYDCYLYSQVAAIAAGKPNEQFIRFFEEIIRIAVEHGVDLNPPWGGAITLGRFTREISASRLGDFFRLLQTYPPLGRSVPVAVRVQYNNYPGNWNGHEIDNYAYVKFNNRNFFE